MQIISWENGDASVTDTPDCADGVLTLLVHHLNDSYCNHIEIVLPGEYEFPVNMICARCSLDILDLAHRVAGTRLSPDDELQVWTSLQVTKPLNQIGADVPRHPTNYMMAFGISEYVQLLISDELAIAGALMDEFRSAATLRVAHEIIDAFDFATATPEFARSTS